MQECLEGERGGEGGVYIDSGQAPNTGSRTGKTYQASS